MVKLRLTRTGRKNFATYRIVAVDSARKRDTKPIEELGHYLPHSKEIKLNEERINYWLSVGAQPTETVARLFVKEGLMKKKDLKMKTFSIAAGRKSLERAEQKQAASEEAAEKAAAPKEEVVADEPAEEAASE